MNAKNIYYKLTETQEAKNTGDILVAVRFVDKGNIEYTWWPKINHLRVFLKTFIAIQKQYKENREELRQMFKMLEGEL